ncbi:MAG: sigma-70 family RNA polymerase sigma factor [Acidobacteriota bacterium]|nr:sigma-70 family RNA polymerase sigma factor [Acidobacteriota bacterium]
MGNFVLGSVNFESKSIKEITGEIDYLDSEDKVILVNRLVELLSFGERVTLADSLAEAINEKLVVYRLKLPAFFQALFGKGSDLKERYINTKTIEMVEQALNTLSPREEKVIKMRFGLDKTVESKTQKLIGKHFAVSASRISQMEAKILEKLRHPSRSRSLKAFLEGKAT